VLSTTVIHIIFARRVFCLFFGNLSKFTLYTYVFVLVFQMGQATADQNEARRASTLRSRLVRTFFFKSCFEVCKLLFAHRFILHNVFVRDFNWLFFFLTFRERSLPFTTSEHIGQEISMSVSSTVVECAANLSSNFDIRSPL